MGMLLLVVVVGPFVLVLVFPVTISNQSRDQRSEMIKGICGDGIPYVMWLLVLLLPSLFTFSRFTVPVMDSTASLVHCSCRICIAIGVVTCGCFDYIIVVSSSSSCFWDGDVGANNEVCIEGSASNLSWCWCCCCWGSSLFQMYYLYARGAKKASPLR